VIGTVSRVTVDGVYVTGLPALPGVELGPLPAVKHRYLDKWQADSGTSTPGAVTTDTKLTAYQAGDRVRVVEDSPNDFIVTGIID
jgi:hypothetical protein